MKSNGIETLFGLLGGSMLELYDAIYHTDGVQYVGARDERAAAHMADAMPAIQEGVLGLSAAPMMRRPECLAVFGPAAFGLSEPFVPLEEIV